MFNVIYTKSLDNSDDVVAKSWEYKSKNDAIALFNEKVKKTMDQAIDNEFINVKLSMHNHRALIRIENTHHVIALVNDGGIFEN